MNILHRANIKQIFIILYTRACCGAVCSVTVDSTTGWTLLYQVERQIMRTVLFNCCCC